MLTPSESKIVESSSIPTVKTSWPFAVLLIVGNVKVTVLLLLDIASWDGFCSPLPIFAAPPLSASENKSLLELARAVEELSLKIALPNVTATVVLSAAMTTDTGANMCNLALLWAAVCAFPDPS